MLAPASTDLTVVLADTPGPYGVAVALPQAAGALPTTRQDCPDQRRGARVAGLPGRMPADLRYAEYVPTFSWAMPRKA